jgi:hypothetical protein
MHLGEVMMTAAGNTLPMACAAHRNRNLAQGPKAHRRENAL